MPTTLRADYSGSQNELREAQKKTRESAPILDCGKAFSRGAATSGLELSSPRERCFVYSAFVSDGQGRFEST
jgi:hypothetical protein